jgi:hypothetical protein
MPLLNEREKKKKTVLGIRRPWIRVCRLDPDLKRIGRAKMTNNKRKKCRNVFLSFEAWRLLL